MNKKNISNRIHTIAIDDNNYQTLRSLGSVGDSFNDVVTSLLLRTAKRKKVEDSEEDDNC
jgi:predicted CopG family antitoxin